MPAQKLVATQTPLGQEAPAGQASTGIQVQVLGWRPMAVAPLTVTLLGFPWHASAVV
jgi:hypothetical protein